MACGRNSKPRETERHNEGETRSKLASMVIDLADAPELNAELAKQEVLQKLNSRSRPVFEGTPKSR